MKSHFPRSQAALIITLAVIGIIVFVWHFADGQQFLRDFLGRIRSLGVWGPLLFIVLYAVACVVLIPASLLTVGAGAVFGFVPGFFYVSIGANLGAAAAFLLGRSLFRDRVTARIAGHPRFLAIDEAVANEGWKIVGLLRLSPVVPFGLLNYALGLTQVSAKEYGLATVVGMIPGTLLYVYVGWLAKEVTGLEISSRPVTSLERGFQVLGLVATVAATIYITRVARKALTKRLKS